MKKNISFLLLLAILFMSCSNDETVVQIIRNPSFTFNINGTSPWKADGYSFGAISKVVVYPEDTSQAGQLYNHFTLQGSGTDSSGNRYEIIISFDVADVDQLPGIYSSHYTAQRGLSQVQLFNLTNSNDLSVYNLCNNMNNDVLQIQKQSRSERLITGAFQMTLCNSRDTTQKINITNGILKDIKY